LNTDKMAEGVRLFLDGLGLSRDETRFPGDEIENTPERVARAWCDDLLAGYARDPAAELSWSKAPAGAGVVLVRGVSFASICVHHLLPFHGQAFVAYLPGERQAGLSKIGRVVDAWARRLQTQEHLTARIVATLHEGLRPRGVLALLEAQHTCMTLRGVRKEQSRMTTLAAEGLYQSDAAARAEILALLRPGAAAVE
jgi:GTP cyclohydrolase I